MRDELLIQLYQVEFANIPTFKSTLFLEDVTVICEDEDEQRSKLRQTAEKMLKDGRPVLVIAENIRKVDSLRKAFDSMNDVYTYKHSYEKLDVFDAEKGLEKPCVILATNLAGRGSDLKINETMSQAGGLHVILTYLPNNKRIEEQAYGRAARKGQNGSGQLIIIEKKNCFAITMKVKRDQLECKRIGEINQHYQSHIKTEEDLFHSFTTDFKKIRADVGKDVEGKANRAKEKIFAESCLYKWALWLDNVNDLLKKQTEEDRQLVHDKYRKFLNEVKNSSNESITCPAIKLKFAKVCVDEKDDTSKQLFDDIINDDPEFAEAAHYYKAHRLIKNKESTEAVFKELQKARELFWSRIIENTSNAFLVNLISQHYTKNTVDSFTPTEGFEEQMNYINQIYQKFIESIDAILGENISENKIKELTVSTSVGQPGAKSLHLDVDEKVQKIPGDPYQAKLLFDALVQCKILEPNYFRKTSAGSSETKKILLSQYRYDTYDILKRLQSFNDGQTLCPEDLKYAIANAEEFWEMVTEESTRQHYILVQKELLMKINLAYSKVQKIFEETVPLASRNDVFRKSRDISFLYLIPKEVDLQEITDERFLIYSKKTLHSCVINFLKELNLYIEIGIGRLKKELRTTPIPRYDCIDVQDLKMIEGMTDEQAEGIFQQLVDTGILTDADPHRISEAALNDLGCIFLEDHAEYREEVIEVIFHCFKYRFALSKSGLSHGSNHVGNGGTEDAGKDIMPVRMVPDFMEFSPHMGLFQNMLQMDIITQRKIKPDIKEEKHLDEILSTLLQNVLKKDHAIFTDSELNQLICDPSKEERILKQMKKLGWIDKHPQVAFSKNILNRSLMTALSTDVDKVDEDPVTDALVKTLLFSKINLMPKRDMVKESILSWQSKYLMLENPDSFLENLKESFHADDIQNKIKTIMIFQNTGLDKLIKLEEMKWTSIFIANTVTMLVIGLAQVAIGIAIEILSKGTLTPMTIFFTCAGGVNLMFVMECAFRGYCTWKEYEKMKAFGLAISYVTCGISAAFSPRAQVPGYGNPSAIARGFFRQIKQSIKTGEVNSFEYKTVANLFSHYLKTIFKAVLESLLEKVEEHIVNDILKKLIRKTSPVAARGMVERMTTEIMEATWPDQCLELMQEIYDKVRTLMNGFADATITVEGMMDSIANWTNKGIVVSTEVSKLSDTFLNLMDSKVEEKLDCFLGEDGSFNPNDQVEEDIRQQWIGLLVETIDDHFTSEVVIPLTKYFGNTLGKKCTQTTKSQYQKTEFNQYRRIFDATLENSQGVLNQREGPDVEDESTQDKYKTQHRVQDAATMTLQRSVEDLTYETQDPDLMAAMCMYDTPLPILFARPLAVISGRPIIVKDLEGKIVQRFSHYGVENATPIEITYKKWHSKEPTAHFYSTKFEDPRESTKNHDCFLRAVNVAVASDELITREELGDLLRTDKHLRDLIMIKNQHGDFYFVDMDKRRKRQSNKGKVELQIRNAHQKV